MTKESWQERYERVVLAAALALVLASGAWWWTHRPDIVKLIREPVAALLSGSAYAAARLPATGGGASNWVAPPAQSHGPEWRYEIFTPPVVYYHAANKAFVVTPPVAQKKNYRTVGFELVEIKPQPYRLQLIGYFGTPGNYVAAFSSPDRAETLLARAGERIDPLGISVRRIEVAKVAVDDAEGQPSFDWTAQAVLNDERAGEEVVLDSRSRRLTGRLTAVLRMVGDPAGRAHEVGEGDTLLEESTACRVTHIQLEPPQVWLERATGSAETEELILSPAGTEVTMTGRGRVQVRSLATDGTERVVTADKGR